ncbi:NAD(P)/FAD-dependent oxidoreductase [Streptomyces monticola]|uniref:NAD(P)/FAD-dependent oxidoreductase n=1 Tax=Streptomyces monticola TaxID=2666263 RepID=A0ABW2JE15_9ACTN
MAEAENVEVVVVGAGMFGAAAAKYLSRAGADVLVVGPGEPERHATAGLREFGAHFDEARIVRRLGWDRFWGTVDTRSTERLRHIEAESGTAFFQECGALALMAQSHAGQVQTMLRESADDSDSGSGDGNRNGNGGGNGVTVERIPEADLRREFPPLGLPPLQGGVEGLLERKGAGYVSPRRLVQAQLDLAVAAGGRLRRGSVTAVRRDESTGLWRLYVEGSGATGSTIGAEKVLVAAGSLVNQSGALPPGHALDLHAFTEPNVFFELDGTQLDRFMGLPAVVTMDPEDRGDANLSHYLLPPVRYADGTWRMKIGPGMQPIVRELRSAQEMLTWYAEQRITPEQRDVLTELMRLMAPGLEPVSVREACCIIDKTHSHHPYIGHLDEDGTLSVAVGGNGRGARGSDEIGRLASRVVLGQRWDFPLPQEVVAPQRAAPLPRGAGSRPEFSVPPFGLC